MSNIALIDYFLLFALLLTTVLIVRGGIANVASALRAGRLRGRGTVYDRHAQPGMFWMGVLFWVVVSAGMIVVNVLAAVAVFRGAS